MITQSEQEYKDFIIRLRFVTGNGASYAIIKKYNDQNIYLRKRHYNYKTPTVLLDLAKNYIDADIKQLLKIYEDKTNN